MIAVIAYRKWNFRAMNVSRAFLRSWPLKRENYAVLPGGEEKDDIARKLLKPLYGLSTACEDWYKSIRDFLPNECVLGGWGVTSVDKSVFFRTQQGYDYGYGGGFRDPNSPNRDKGILKGDGNFETIGQRKCGRSELYTSTLC